MVSSRKIPNAIREWLIFAACILALAGWEAYSSYEDYRQTTKIESERLSAQVNVLHDMSVRELESVRNTLTYLRKALPIGKLRNNQAYTNAQLKAFAEALPSIRTLAIMDASGSILGSNHVSLIGKNFRYRDYFQAPQKSPHPDTLYVSLPFKTSLDVWTINLSLAIIDPAGKFTGVITASLDPNEFRTLLNSVRYAPDLRSAILHGEGIVYMMSPEQKDLIGQDVNLPGTIFARHIGSGRTSNVFTGKFYLTSDERILAIRTLESTAIQMDRPPVIAVSRDYAAAHARCRQDMARNGGLVLLLAIASSIGLYFLQQRRWRRQEERTASAQKLKEAQVHLESFLNIAPDLLCIADLEGNFLELNPSWEEVLGYPIAELKGARFLDFVHPDDMEATITTMSTLARGEKVTGFVNRYRHKNGSYRYIEWRTAPVGYLLYAVARDVTARVRSEESFRHQAFYDELTDLPNRALLIERLQQEMAHAKRNRNLIALLFIDLDKFKPVNDIHGHRVGDWLLQKVSTRITHCIRESDTAARIGGDEFVVLLPRISMASNALDIAENIRHALEQPFATPENLILEISASIGIAIYPDHASTVQDLLAAGDEAMYEAKNAGRNKVAILGQTGKATPLAE